MLMKHEYKECANINNMLRPLAEKRMTSFRANTKLDYIGNGAW